MDQYDPMTQDTESAWDAEQLNPWNDPTNIIQKHVAHLIRNANVHNDRVTAGGDRDMNAALVESTRSTLYLSVALELQGLLAEVRDAQAAEAQERNRLNRQVAQRAYAQGVADGLEKAEQARENAETEAAPKLDLATLDALQVLHSDSSAVRVVDGMDGSSDLTVYAHTLAPEQALENAKPGMYVRLTVRQDSAPRAIDLNTEQWLQLRQAVDTLTARRQLADAEDGAES